MSLLLRAFKNGNGPVRVRTDIPDLKTVAEAKTLIGNNGLVTGRAQGELSENILPEQQARRAFEREMAREKSVNAKIGVELARDAELLRVKKERRRSRKQQARIMELEGLVTLLTKQLVLFFLIFCKLVS